MLIIQLFILAGAIILATVLPFQDWRRIIVLRSTRSEVEQLIGSAKSSTGFASTYQTSTETILVTYSGEACLKKEGWNVPLDTVLSFTVLPNSKLRLTTLKLDQTKFTREPDSHIKGAIHYINRGDGIRVETRSIEGESEFVLSITYQPGAGTEDLRCSPAQSPAQMRSSTLRDSDIHLPRKFDEFTRIAVSDEQARLKSFATYLQNEPKHKGYMIVYHGKQTVTDDVEMRTNRLRSFLLSLPGIDETRIVTLEGGCRETSTVELYALPSDVPPPIPNPPPQE